MSNKQAEEIAMRLLDAEGLEVVMSPDLAWLVFCCMADSLENMDPKYRSYSLTRALCFSLAHGFLHQDKEVGQMFLDLIPALPDDSADCLLGAEMSCAVSLAPGIGHSGNFREKARRESANPN